ncbi:MAG: competence/damage-inducible protein A [Actinobacteria bacterium]|nr:competence/damage-inducible protein A [Actinomycetota bacterium]
MIAVGTELLLGQIVDTNSSWIGEQLAANGIDSLIQVKVGDNRERIVNVLRSALADADAVIMCGGLGPTHDDLTRDALAEVMGQPLELHDDIAAVIRSIFESRGRRMSDNNLQQAMVPRGATVIHQTRGTAPGLICPMGDKVVYALPGVPHEMHDMMERAVLPDLRRRGGDTSVIASRVIRTWGESESGLNERLNPIIAELESLGSPTLAFLASGWEGIKVRLTAKGATAEEARATLDEWDARVCDVVGEIVFGRDGQTMESVVLDQCRDRGLTLGLAESVTGGLVAGRLTAVPGASDVLRGSVVSYASEVKFDLLGVPRGPVVSEAAAVAMAEEVCRVLGSTVGLSLTGVAGPTEQDGQPVGTLWVGVALPDQPATATRLLMPGQRDQMRQMAVISALDLLRRRLAGR